MIFLLIGISASLLLQAQVSITVANNAGGLNTILTAEQLSSVTNLTITGTIDANDVAIINNAMPALTTLDIGNTTLLACVIPTVDSFVANWFPGPSLSKNSLNYGGLTKPLLTSIILPSTVQVLGSSAFESSGLTSVTIPATVSSIGWSAFARSLLTSISIPSSVSYMDEWVFNGCINLKEVIMEAALINIPQGTFAGCSSLNSVNIPSTVTRIGMSAFTNCFNLKSIVLPPSVSYIDMTAFFGCSGLTSIYSNNPVPPQTQSSFGQVDKAGCTLYVPIGSKELYAAAPEWQEFINIVEDPGLTLSSNTVDLGPENNSSSTIRLHSQSSWTITSNQSWLLINPASGNKNETITFTAQANPLFEARTATAIVSTNDGYSETVTVTQAAKTNTIPVANAGNDQTVEEGTTVHLDGSASSDADNDALQYHWYAPEGIALSSSTSATPSFTAPQVENQTNLTFILVVNDGKVNSAEDRIVVTILNRTELSVSDNTVDLGAANNSTATTDLYCNTAWNASSNRDWLTVSPPSGNVNHLLTFTAQANPNYTARTATVTITADGLTVTVTVIQQGRANIAPVANAGNNQTVNEGETVQLDGSASSDADGNALTYRWTAPEGITLSSNTAARPTFTAPQVDRNTDYNFTLVVNDGSTNSPEDLVVITIANKVELSVSTHAVSVGAEENLSASVQLQSNSSWEAGSDHNWLSVNPTTGNGNQQLTLTAQPNSLLTSRSASVTVTAAGLSETITITQQGKANSAPVANAGNDQTVHEGETVQLDGSASFDADGNVLTYHWTAPEGITLSSTTNSKPTFTAPQVDRNTAYTLTLAVNDGQEDSPADMVTITVINKAELSISEKSITIGAADNSLAAVNVHCNTNWNASCHHDWLTITPETYNGDQTLTFTAKANPLTTVRTAEVFVSTPEGLSDTITVTQQAMANTAPVANAGTDRWVSEGDLIQLNGSASSDIDNDALTYLWTAPPGIVLNSTTDAMPTFTAPLVEGETQFIFTLVVNDGQVNSAEDQVIITITNKVIEMNLSTSAATVDYKESKVRIILSGNAQWNASSDQPWLTVSPTSGTGDQMLLITALANSTYTERTGTITVSAPGVDSKTFVVTQSRLPVGIEEFQAKTLIKYYPSPFSQEMTIEIVNTMHKEVSVDIYSISGQRIKSLANQRKDENINLLWNGANEQGQIVPYGMYILKINNEAKQVVFKGR
jgi:hypothetical protein